MGNTYQDLGPAFLAELRENRFKPEEIPAAAPIGTGDQWVYLYYFPHVRNAARAEWQARWPLRITRWLCKVGSTIENDPRQRVRELVGLKTGAADCPVIALQIRTPDAKHLEQQVIHAELKRRGLHYSNDGGREWFRTNPEEVRGIYRRWLARTLPAWRRPFFLLSGSDEAPVNSSRS